MPRRTLVVFWIACSLLGTLPLSAVVISEISYHPPPGDEALEFIEIANDSATPEDISGWVFVEGIFFEIPPGTVLAGYERIAICADVDAVASRHGDALGRASGDFVGRLDNIGERVTLVDHAGIVVSSLRYRDAGKWPVAPDGTGHTLSLRSVHLDPKEPESWTHSSELGGTPGRANFPTEDVVVEETLIPRGADWRYRRGSVAFSVPIDAWRQGDFDDASWPIGTAGFGFETLGDPTTAYVVASGVVGNQAFGGSLGMDFDVERDVVITELGVFDSGADGLGLTITARLWNRDTQEEVASITFSPGDPGELAGGSRFKALDAPLALDAGFRGVIVAEGYGGAEPNGNQGSTPLDLTTDGGDGTISFVGRGRYGTFGAFPGTVDGGPENRYAAGTFRFVRADALGGDPTAPAGVATLLDDMPGRYTSLACRASFELDAEDVESDGDLVLGVAYNDGFCAFLNGSEIVRANCGEAGEEPRWNDVATAIRAGRSERLFVVPDEDLVEGENVLAIVGFNASRDDPDFVLHPRLFRRRIVGGSGSASRLVFNELERGAMPGEGWVEIFNAGPSSVDLSGLGLHAGTPAATFAFPEGIVVGGRGFLVVEAAAAGLDLSTAKVQLFLRDPDGLVVSAATFDRTLPDGVGGVECRFPDGGELDWISATPTPGAPNEVEAADDVVIHEIFYNPPHDRPGEYVELYNRGDTVIDVSGFRFSDGIDYALPDGTVIVPGGYLVIAEDPDFLRRHYGVVALGPYDGRLSNRGEAIGLVDRLGNPVDRVRYFDGGRWSHWADGGGSSLELIDPLQDNSFASAWAASDESHKAAWQELSFHVPAYRTGRESELNLYLVESGECAIDDVAVRRSGGANLIGNPSFESSTASWLIGGTHVRSFRTTDEAHSGDAALQIVSTGKGDTLVNRIETETSPPMTNGPYDVSLWARWQRGSDLLVVHGEYSAGPYRVAPCITCGSPEPNLGGNPMAAALRMSIPLDLGTPGAENSVTTILREQTGATNLGPVIADVEHDPPMPAPGAPIAVRARVMDADGIASVHALYRLGSAAGAFEAIELHDDGQHGDGDAGDGLWGGWLPALNGGARVVFFVEAVDALGASRSLPLAAPDDTLVFQVVAAPTGRLDDYSVVLDTARSAELSSRQLHSNDLLAGSFVFEDDRVHYDVGVRYRGSPWGRPSRASLRVRFPDDDRFHRGLRDMNVSKTGRNANEGAAIFLTRRNAVRGRPSAGADYLWADVWFNGGFFGRKAMIEGIDGDYLDRWFGDGSRGPLLKANGRFVFTDAGGLIGQSGWEGASLVYRGENPENYRGYYVHGTRQSADDWTPLFDLTRTLDRSRTPDAVFGEEVDRIVDLDRFFRVLSTRVLLGDGDAFAVNNGHNGYIVHDSLAGLWSLIPFDLEASFRGNFGLFSSLDPGVQRLLDHPRSRREYLRVLAAFVDGGYWSSRADPWLDAVQSATGYGVSGIKNHVRSNASRARSAVASSLEVEFRIVTNAGVDFAIDADEVDLAGDAPVNAAQVLWSRDGGDLLPLAAIWTDTTRWSTTFRLRNGANAIALIAFDDVGDLVGSDSIVVTTTGGETGGFVRGDANADGSVDVSDAVRALRHLFAGSEIDCRKSADVDDNGQLEVTDVVVLLDFLFRGGERPVAPAEACGDDPTEDDLTCESYPPCGL